MWCTAGIHQVHEQCHLIRHRNLSHRCGWLGIIRQRMHIAAWAWGTSSRLDLRPWHSRIVLARGTRWHEPSHDSFDAAHSPDDVWGHTGHAGASREQDWKIRGCECSKSIGSGPLLDLERSVLVARYCDTWLLMSSPSRSQQKFRQPETKEASNEELSLLTVFFSTFESQKY